jgi:MYXO-CTERM domain-containing protein
MRARAALIVFAFSSAASAATLQVGPGKAYAMPCDAIAAASAGDTIQVDASGSYDGNTCAWTTDNLTLVGVNGRPKIDLTGVTPAQQKGIFTIGGTASATIDNFELSGAAISYSAGNNGAGIRHQGLNLTVRNCFIHDNQDGILGAPATPNTGTILIENTEFSSNGAGDGYSHNMYIGDFAQFTLQYSYSHLAKVGHLVKSRAYVTRILYNRLTDELGGTASYETDIPNAGTAFIVGNLIEQSSASQNPTIMTFGEEGTPSGYDTHLYVVNNTVINDLGSGTFVANATSTPAAVMNNIFYGGGTVDPNAADVLTTNFSTGNPMFVDVASYDVHLLAGSPCIDQGTDPGKAGAMSLDPIFEYVQPVGDEPRTVVGKAIDIGAYEFGLPDGGPPGDGGSGGTDGGKPRVDAGGKPRGDAGNASKDGSSADGSGDGGAGGSPTGASGGCGCVAAGYAGDAPIFAGLGPGLLAMLLLRRRRVK